MYLLNKHLLTVLGNVEPNHDSLEHAISQYAQTGKVKVAITDKQTVSLKYTWDLLHLGKYLLEKTSPHIAKNVSIAKNVIIQGHVVIEEGVRIMENVCIKGPCYIGKGSFIGNNAIIRDGVITGENVVIGANLEIKNTILMDGTTTHYGFIGDSIFGRNAKIAGNITVGNVRLDRAPVKVTLNDKHIDTNIHALGVIAGDNVQMGVSVSTMPGVIIGNNTIIGPSTTVMENIEENMRYYTQFKTIIKRES